MMLLVMSFGGLCALEAVLSCGGTTFAWGGRDYSSIRAQGLLLGPAAAAPAVPWPHSNLQVLLLACFPFPAAATAKP